MFFKKKNIALQPDITSPSGFEAIYNACFDKMYEIGIYQVGDEEITKEIIQEFFTSIWEKRETLAEKEKIEYYLVRIFKYRIIDYFRAEAIRQKYSDEVALDYCDARHCTEERVLHTELKNNVNLLVDQLSCQCRKVYKMSREQGMSNKEIASALLISERAVAYHLAKAFSFLQEKLQLYKVL